MPPGKRLARATVAAFARWVAEGAVWPAERRSSARPRRSPPRRHWAFEPVKPVDPPADPTGWSDHPIDRFVARRPPRGGLRPVARRPADAAPPGHVRPDRPAADARGDRRLPRRRRRPTPSPGWSTGCSPRRITASAGAGTGWTSPATPTPPATTPTTRSPRSYRYRDYIIDSFNADKPYDQFVREQLAGDILARAGARRGDTPSRSSPPASSPCRAATRRPLRALAPDARGRDRHDRPRLPRA